MKNKEVWFAVLLIILTPTITVGLALMATHYSKLDKETAQMEYKQNLQTIEAFSSKGATEECLAASMQIAFSSDNDLTGYSEESLKCARVVMQRIQKFRNQ